MQLIEIAMPLAVAFVTLGDISLAIWARTSSQINLPLGLLLNAIGILMYAFSLRQENIAVATAIFLGLNIAAMTLVSSRLFSEHLSAANIFGVVMVVAAVILMEL